MSFREFLQSIRSPELKNVADHWNQRRGKQATPGWNDIRPSEIAAQLPLIWVYKYDREGELGLARELRSKSIYFRPRGLAANCRNVLIRGSAIPTSSRHDVSKEVLKRNRGRRR